MDGVSGAWLYPLILIAGALQAWGPPMNGALRNALKCDRWLILMRTAPKSYNAAFYGFVRSHCAHPNLRAALQASRPTYPQRAQVEDRSAHIAR